MKSLNACNTILDIKIQIKIIEFWLKGLYNFDVLLQRAVYILVPINNFMRIKYD